MTERPPNIRPINVHPAMSGAIPAPGFRAALSRLLRRLFGE
jgi:hypothetical protein